MRRLGIGELIPSPRLWTEKLMASPGLLMCHKQIRSSLLRSKWLMRNKRRRDYDVSYTAGKVCKMLICQVESQLDRKR